MINKPTNEQTYFGWTVEETSKQRIFRLGTRTVWQVRDGWMCADLEEGHYKNHRFYGDLHDALQKETN
jgi:hypothetical protein